MTEPLNLDVAGFLNPMEAGLLRDLSAAAPKCGTIVELCSYRFKSTVALALYSQISGATVWAIDPHESYRQGDTDFGPLDSSAFLQNIVAAGVTDVVRVINLSSNEVSDIWQKPI